MQRIVDNRYMDKKQKVFDFIKGQKHMVVATVNADGTAEAALVGFGQQPDLTIVFGTNTKTRKYVNLERTGLAAIVISDDETSVQMQGTVQQLSGEQQSIYTEAFFAKI